MPVDPALRLGEHGRDIIYLENLHISLSPARVGTSGKFAITAALDTETCPSSTAAIKSGVPVRWTALAVLTVRSETLSLSAA